MGFIMDKVREESVTQDILQDVFIKIHSKIDTLKDETKFRPWVYQITRNIIADHFRKKGIETGSFSDFVENDHDDTDNLMTETINDMIKMMNDLPEEYCDALCMTELKGMSIKTYAQNTGISYTAAKTRVQRARIKLKDLLMKCCHYQFDKYGTVISIHPAGCCCCIN